MKIKFFNFGPTASQNLSKIYSMMYKSQFATISDLKLKPENL